MEVDPEVFARVLWFEGVATSAKPESEDNATPVRDAHSPEEDQR